MPKTTTASNQKHTNTLANKWSNEYIQSGIPSSVREKPSSAVVHYFNFLQSQGITTGKITDLGCGKGRNSAYLAKLGFKLTAIDLCNTAIEYINKKYTTLNINTICQDLTKPWLFSKTNQFIGAIDTFCFKHIISKSARLFYKTELKRILQKNSYILINLADITDNYYSQHCTIHSDKYSQKDATLHITDPGNHIESLLYSKEALVDFFEPEFKLVNYKQVQHSSIMYGKAYQRSIHRAIFKRISPSCK